jgi:hypothetical protein
MTNPDPATPTPAPGPPWTEPGTVFFNPDPAAPTPGRTGPPWTEPGTVFFYGGFMSNFAPTPGLRLPFGYHGHHERDRVPVFSAQLSTLSLSVADVVDGAWTHRRMPAGAASRTAS